MQKIHLVDGMRFAWWRSMSRPEPGMKAPGFEAKDQDGRTRTLSEFRGKHVVLFFYPEDDTPGCTKEACGFRDSWTRFEAAEAVVLGVSTDDVASHRRFREKYDLPFTLLADEDHAIMDAYGVRRGERAQRVTFLIGPDGGLLQVYPKVDAAAHAEQILSDLQAP